MAQLDYYSFSWIGSGFRSGDIGVWWVGGLFYEDVVGVTAQPINPIRDSGQVRTLSVEKVKVRADDQGNRDLIITIRNEGPSEVRGYAVNISFVTP